MTKLIFGLVVLSILLGLAFGYCKVVGPKRELLPVENSPSVKTPEFETPPAEVREAAEGGLPEFLRSLAYDEVALESYGIKSAEEVQSATLGGAYLLYAIGDLTQLANYSQKQKVSFLITPEQTWYFGVLINSEPRVDLNVSWHEGCWQTVGIGGSWSKEMHALESDLPKLLKEKGVVGVYSFKLVKIPPMNAVFVLAESEDKEFIVPLTPTGWFGLEEKKLYPAEEAMFNFAREARRILEEENIKEEKGVIER